MRALVFHPAGKHLLSASDDKTLRIWDLTNGRCIKTIDAHGHFVTCLAWGRALMGGSEGGDGKANGSQEPRRINVIATGSVDQTIKVSRARTLDFGAVLTGRFGRHKRHLD